MSHILRKKNFPSIGLYMVLEQLCVSCRQYSRGVCTGSTYQKCWFNSCSNNFCRVSCSSQSDEKIGFSCTNKACLKETHAHRLPIKPPLLLSSVKIISSTLDIIVPYQNNIKHKNPPAPDTKDIALSLTCRHKIISSVKIMSRASYYRSGGVTTTNTIAKISTITGVHCYTGL
jgi:hypothetical protein